jgi:hypothetical protein
MELFYEVLFGVGTVTLGIVIVLLRMIRHAHREMGMGWGLATVTDTRLKAANCLDCGHTGVQFLNWGIWGPGTQSQLMVTDQSPYKEAPQANKRTCTTCQGKGFNWLEIPVNHNYQPPNMGYLENTRKWIYWPWK